MSGGSRQDLHGNSRISVPYCIYYKRALYRVLLINRVSGGGPDSTCIEILEFQRPSIFTKKMTMRSTFEKYM